MTEVGRIEVNAKLNDADLLAGLRRAEAAVDRTAAKIDGQRAEFKVGADVSELDRKLAEAQAKLDRLKARREARVKIGGDTDRLDKAIAAQSKELQKGLKIREDSYRLEQMSARAAEQRRNAEITHAARMRAEVAKLTKEYSRQTDVVERAQKRMAKAFGREARFKAEVDVEHAVASLELTKAKLNALGAHPPVHIKVDTDLSHLSGFRKGLALLKRDAASFGAAIGNRLSNLGEATVRLGPFTTSIKGLIGALAILGPTLTDVTGAASALIGVTGAGIAGAATVGAAAITGLGTAFLGFKFALGSTADEYKTASQATDAYNKALLKYGAGSKEAKKAQEQMNNVLKNVGPLAAEAAKGVSGFRSQFEKATEGARKSMANTVKGFFGALSAGGKDSVLNGLADNTNRIAKIVDKNLQGAFKFLKSPEFKSSFDEINKNFRSAITPFMHGLGNFGQAFLNFAREGSKALKPMMEGFDNLGARLLAFTQRDTFGATVARWIGYARDLAHFFGAATSVMVHFFGTGSRAGDKFLNDMTNALNRWDDFIQSTEGQKKFGKFFDDAVKGTQELYAALAPLVQLFAVWSAGLAPAVRVVTQVSAAITRLVNAIGHLVGLDNAMSAFGATLGAMFVVSKIGAFVGMLGRAVGLMKELGAASSVAAIATGRFGKMSTAREAANIAGNVGAGALAGAGARRVEGKAAAEAAKDVAKYGAAAGVAEGAVGRLTLRTLAMSSGIGLAATAVGILGYKLLTAKSSAEKIKEALKGVEQNTTNLRTASDGLNSTYNQLGANQAAQTRNTKSLAALQREYNKLQREGKDQTAAGRDVLSQINQKLTERNQIESNGRALNREKAKLEQANTDALKKAENATSAYNKALVEVNKARDRARAEQALGVSRKDAEDHAHLADKVKLLSQAERDLAASKKQVAAASAAKQIASIAEQRGLKDFQKLSQDATIALASLQRAAPKTALKVALKFPDSRDVAKVSQAAQQAIKSGTPPKIVARIVADSKSADDAVRRINRVQLTTKNLKIIHSGGKEALSILNDLVGKKLAPKVQQILASDASARSKIKQLQAIGIKAKTAKLLANDSDAMAKLRRIEAKKIADKRFSVKANDNASGILSGIIGMLSRVTSKTVTVTTVNRTVGSKLSSRYGGANAASGGFFAFPDGGWAANPNQRQIERAARTAEMSGARRTRGGKYSQPTLLVGEENRSEFVISTNPKYRNRNRDYLAMAARSLGMGVMSAASGFGSFTGSAFNPKATIATPKYLKKKPHTLKGKMKQRRGYSDYIEGLETQQGYWEREVGIRQSQVREPADWIIQKGTTKVTDKVTGETVDVPNYVANEGPINEYKKQLQAVNEAMTTLLRIIAQIVRAVPKAIQSNLAEAKERNGRISFLNHEIAKEKAKKGGSKEQQQARQDRIERLRKERDKHIDINNGLRDDRKTLNEKRIEAGFDYREVTISQKQLNDDLTAAGLKGQADANAANADAIQNANFTGGTGSDGTSGGSTGDGSGTDGGASGTSTDQGLSIAAQTALVLQQNNEALRAFGQNFIDGNNNGAAQFTPGPVAGSSSGSAYSSGSQAASYMTSSGATGGGYSGSVDNMGNPTNPMGGGSSGGGATVNNYFNQPPPDPHTWSQGVAYELGSSF